jgi:hypothetical protein
MAGLRPTGPALGLYTLGCSSIYNNLPYRWIFDRPSGQPHMSWFPITNSQVCKNRTGTISMLNTSITLHHLEAKLMLYIHWENPSPLFTGSVTTCIYIYLHLHAGYSFQRKYSSSSYLHYSITLNIKETVHIYLFLFTFFLLGIIDIVRIQCKA